MPTRLFGPRSGAEEAKEAREAESKKTLISPLTPSFPRTALKGRKYVSPAQVAFGAYATKGMQGWVRIDTGPFHGRFSSSIAGLKTI
jgi:hypothetical protein